MEFELAELNKNNLANKQLPGKETTVEKVSISTVRVSIKHLTQASRSSFVAKSGSTYGCFNGYLEIRKTDEHCKQTCSNPFRSGMKSDNECTTTNRLRT